MLNLYNQIMTKINEAFDRGVENVFEFVEDDVAAVVLAE